MSEYDGQRWKDSVFYSKLEGISKIGFWFQRKAAVSFPAKAGFPA